MAVIIGTDCRDVAEEDVYRYVLGYTAANDVSSRKSQFDTSQWTFSKGFDNSCPLGEWRSLRFQRRADTSSQDLL